MCERIQLRRTKGWRKPAGAIVVARPSRWGNPFRVSAVREALNAHGVSASDAELQVACVRSFTEWLEGDGPPVLPEQRRWILSNLPNLAGHDLACWCPLDQPCHADVLLEAANAS